MADIQRSLAYSAAQSYLGVALQLVSTVVLSRVLTPAEVGAFAVAAVFAALASNFRDFGIAEYLIQVKDLSHRNIRAAFAVNIMTSWAMGLLLFGTAGWVGDFYRADVVTQVMRVQAFNFLLIPFGAINMAWFRREMNFKPAFFCGVLSDIVSLCTSVTLALHGLGAMSMAWATLAGTAVVVVVSMLFRPKAFPRWPSLQGVREVLKFGSFASGIYVLGQLGKGAPEMIIGRAQGVTDVAIFSRAAGLVQLFRQLVVRAIMPVCLPYFAKSVREESSVIRAYVRGSAIFTVIGWTFLGFLALAAFPVIRIVYGAQWTESVPLARIVCLAGAVELVHYLAKDALLAHGKVQVASRLQLLLQLTQIVGLMAVVPFGLMGACWGMLASAAVGMGLSQWHLRSDISLTLAHTWNAVRQSTIVTVVALAPMAVLFFVMPASEQNYVRQLALGAAATGLCWLLALRASGHPLWADLAQVGQKLRQRLPPALGGR